MDVCIICQAFSGSHFRDFRDFRHFRVLVCAKLIGLQVLHRHFKANGKKDKVRMENGMNKMYKLLEMSSIE